MRECVVLVPGLFGFGSFGKDQRTPIAYFDRCIDVLLRERPSLKREDVHVHEPPPTGSLESRVESLFQRLLVIVGRESLRGERLPLTIHLIGHSTGGVDVRLLTNDRYYWTGMDEELRAQVIANIGTVVTISAPLHGTPIARDLRWIFDLIVDGLSLWQILDRADTGGRRSAATSALLSLCGWLSSRVCTNGPVLEFIAGMDQAAAREIQAFRSWILTDCSLIGDLTPESMRHVNGPLEGHDHHDMKHFVTVAPPPGGIAFDDLLRCALYRLCYWGASSGSFVPDEWPDPGWYAKHADQVDDVPLANDGVVPVSSQFLRQPRHSRHDGQGPLNPCEIVFADHLDVPGHFDGRRNTTAFKSGAAFGHVDHEAVWKSVARALRAPGTPASQSAPSVTLPAAPGFSPS